MTRTSLIHSASALCLAAMLALPAHAQEPWQRLPPTPSLPHPDRQGSAAVGGIRLWYAVLGEGRGSPVMLLHGGLANADYWGGLIPALARTHEVIVLDSRGHGRSTRNTVPIGYDLMADDVAALLDTLNMPAVAVIGWSDGAITGLDLALRHPAHVTRVFAFAANADPSGVKDVHASPVFSAFIARAAREYTQRSPTPRGYAAFDADIERMWASQPHFTAAMLRTIRAPVWIVDGDHDEAIKRSDTDFLATAIPGAREMILPGVSHFAFLQDPAMFLTAVQAFLAGQPAGD